MSDAFIAFTADSAQQHNPAGASWIIKVNTEHFMKPWPAAGDIQNGVIVNMPLLRADAGLPRITPVPGTLYYRDALVGRYGHQFYRHELGYEIANDTQLINRELEKDVNSTAVFIVGKSDGTMRVLGKSSAGLQINNESDSGLEGGENKTTVKAISNVQTRKNLILSPNLETDILSGNDGYGLNLRSSVFPILTSATSIDNIELINTFNVSIDRKFAVNDLVEIRRVDITALASGTFRFLEKTDGFITGTISAASNAFGPTVPGFVDRISINNLAFFNISASTPNVSSVGGGVFSIGGRVSIQKL
jgi:hypothetical protein